MDTSLRRGLLAELLGTFAVVYFSAGAVCVNFLTTPAGQPGLSLVHGQQPGLVGVALAQGLIFAAVLAVTVQLSGGFLNPAITLMLWVFNRLDNKRTAALIIAQLAGALLAGTCLRFTFDDAVLRDARLGTPHLNVPLAFRFIETASIIAGTSVELLLTFFLVFAIFAASRNGGNATAVALPAGLILVAGTFVAGPLTGAAANPARWFGTVLWEQLLPGTQNPWTDTFVYLAGPILGALAGGLVAFRFLALEPGEPEPAKPATAPAAVKQAVSAAKRK